LRTRWDELLETRRRVSYLLLQPPTDLKARDRELAQVTQRREQLERELDRLLPELAGQRKLEALTPADLAQRLPEDAALVDLVRYFDRGKDRQESLRYTAFVLRHATKVVRVDLGEAGPIDRAAAQWRQALLGWSPALSARESRDLERQADAHGATLRRLVWEPLAGRLSAGVKTVYLLPDGDLARLPWAALPGSTPGTVLLEEYALAVVPHAPFLLEALLRPAGADKAGAGLPAVGGVDYGPGKTWSALQGSDAEVR
jgi:hypothetical protein